MASGWETYNLVDLAQNSEIAVDDAEPSFSMKPTQTSMESPPNRSCSLTVTPLKRSLRRWYTWILPSLNLRLNLDSFEKSTGDHCCLFKRIWRQHHSRCILLWRWFRKIRTTARLDLRFTARKWFWIVWSDTLTPTTIFNSPCNVVTFEQWCVYICESGYGWSCLDVLM